MADLDDSRGGSAAASGPSDPRLLQLAPEDNVAAAKTGLAAGESILIAGRQVVLRQAIPTGHKVAIAPIRAGEKVRKYGAPIGSATQDLEPGEYVHIHNVKSDYLPTYTYDNLAPGTGV